MNTFEHNPEHKNGQEDWQEEFFYFGAGQSETYRRRGEQVQFQAELVFPVSSQDDSPRYKAPVEGAAEFLEEFEDCSFSIGAGYMTSSGDYVPPSLILKGWKDLRDEDRAYYEQSKVSRWIHPDER